MSLWEYVSKTWARQDWERWLSWGKRSNHTVLPEQSLAP